MAIEQFSQQLQNKAVGILVTGAVVSVLVMVGKVYLEKALIVVFRFLKGSPKKARRGVDEASENAVLDAPPACPKCGVAMVKRTARQGANAGSRFWGCRGFPSCRGTRG